MQQVVGVTGPSNQGKTTLIRAMMGFSGMDLLLPDSMESTTDAGYLEVEFPKSGPATLVDLPGHERYLTNMIAGAFQMDIAVYVVAADDADSVEMQSSIRLLEFLPVKQLLFAVTRIDSATQDDIDAIQSRIVDAIYTTRFLTARIAFVSPITGEGMAEFTEALDLELIKFRDTRVSEKSFFLPVDRVVLDAGREVMVMGTVAEGRVEVGQEIELVPNLEPCKVLSIMKSNTPRHQAEHGERVAITIRGSNMHAVGRGSCLASKGNLTETALLDVKLEWASPVEHRDVVHLSIGTDDVIGKIFLNESDSSRAQIRLNQAIAAKAFQPVLVRSKNGMTLVGSGFVLQPQGETRIKREVPVTELTGPILKFIQDHPAGVFTNDVCAEFKKTPQELGIVFEKLIAEGSLISFAGLWFTPTNFLEEAKRFLSVLAELHAENPYLLFQPREAVVQRMESEWPAKPLDRIIQKLWDLGKLEVDGNGVRLKNFKIALSKKQQEFLDRVMEVLNQYPIEVPYPSDVARMIGAPVRAVEEIILLGVNSGQLYAFSDTIFYTDQHINGFKVRLHQVIGKKYFNIAEAREVFGTSRRFLIPILEHLDSIGFTQRTGEDRLIVAATDAMIESA